MEMGGTLLLGSGIVTCYAALRRMRSSIPDSRISRPLRAAQVWRVFLKDGGSLLPNRRR
jgi:hypothetical protein